MPKIFPDSVYHGLAKCSCCHLFFLLQPDPPDAEGRPAPGPVAVHAVAAVPVGAALVLELPIREGGGEAGQGQEDEEEKEAVVGHAGFCYFWFLTATRDTQGLLIGLVCPVKKKIDGRMHGRDVFKFFFSLNYYSESCQVAS